MHVDFKITVNFINTSISVYLKKLIPFYNFKALDNILYQLTYSLFETIYQHYLSVNKICPKTLRLI